MAQQVAFKRQDYRLLQKIGTNIVYYRKQLGLTREKLAEMVDIGTSHLARVESGMGAASLPLLFSLSDALEIPLKDLFDFPEGN